MADVKCEYRATPHDSPSTSVYSDDGSGVKSGYWPGEYYCSKGLYESVITWCYGCPDMKKKEQAHG